MTAHMLDHSVNVSEITDMAQLIDLIMTDGLHGQLVTDVFKVVVGSSQCRNTGAGNADL